MKSFILFSSIITSAFFQSKQSIKGKWEYWGGIYNGKTIEPPGVYTMWRKYSAKDYKGFTAGDGTKKHEFEAGTYVFQGDSCIETPTYSIQRWKIINVPIHYRYTLRADTLTLKGVWPGGVHVEEYWVKVK